MFQLFLSFLKIGVISFGGGYGMISVLSEEVLSHGWLTEQQLLSFIGVAESTPGPIAVNMATFVGASQGEAIIGGTFGSLLGALTATFAVILPAFIIILCVAALISGLLKFAGVKSFLFGVRPVVVALIIGTSLTIFLSVVLGLSSINDTVSFDWRSLLILAIICLTYYIVKFVFKKNISPIILILSSAVLGILFYGVLGFL